MRVLSCFLVLISSLIGIHASAIQPQVQPSSYHQEITAAASHTVSRVFHSMASSTNVAGVSQACQTSIDTISSNANVMAAHAQITHGGCTDLNFKDPSICRISQTSSNTGTINCNCLASLSNTDAFVSSVQSLGGKACPVSLSMTMVVSGNNKYGQHVTATMYMQQTMQDYQIFGPQCSNQDIQNALDAVAKMGGNELTTAASAANNGASLDSYTISVTACSTTSTRSGTGSMIGVSWFTLLCVILISSIMMKQ